MYVRKFALILGFVVEIVGCAGASDGQPSKPTVATSDAPEMTGVRKRLQGTWEVVRYRSANAVPNDAVPLMADLFDSLRLQFEPTQALVSTSITTNEKMAYEPTDEHGENFKLSTNGGMFDGASCHFVGPDEWEVVDEGPVWPGTSVLRRVKR